MTQVEFEALLADSTKVIGDEIRWSDDEDHSPAVEFRVEVTSDAGYPISVRGSYNPEAKTLTYALIHRGEGRIYALDIGKDHHNPTCERVGDKHKHHWTEANRDKHAYVPDDIHAAVDDVVEVWREFCLEANITHQGTMHQPPPRQEEPF